MGLTTIYVEIVNEDVDVFRPVEAERLEDDLFRIVTAKDDPEETWSFPTGAVVRCRMASFDDGRALLAVEAIERDRNEKS